MKTSAMITNIQKFSVHDGPGIRSTVFFKGCPLSCKWCANPENIRLKSQISFSVTKCIQCGECGRVCPQHFPAWYQGNRNIDRKNCTSCGKCAEQCCTEALTLIGNNYTSDEVIYEVNKDIPYFQESVNELGTMAGILSIPFALIIMTLISKFGHIKIRPDVSGAGDRTANSTYVLNFDWGQILLNMIPVVVFCIVLAVLLILFMKIMLKIFLVLGRIVEIGIRIVVVLAIIEYFTGIFSKLFGGHWQFEPLMADDKDQFRAIENTGYVVFMMVGAFPMIYLLKKYLSKAAGRIGKRVGFSSNGIIGLITSWADIVISFSFYNRIRPKDKVMLTAYAICGAWILASHLSITVTYQPNLVAVVLIGKIAGGVIAILLAKIIAVPAAAKLEENDRKLGIIGPDEYINDEMTEEEIEEMTKS